MRIRAAGKGHDGLPDMSRKWEGKHIRLEYFPKIDMATMPVGFSFDRCQMRPKVMARYFWKNLSPWLEGDVRKALDRPEVDIFRKQPYVGFHIRRGDKVAEGEAAKVETHKYLEAALKYYQDRSAGDAEGIKAVWVASDDKDAVKEVRAIVRHYFPNVADKDVVWVSGANAGGEVATHSTSEAYEGFVMVFADLKMLSAARVFVGTYSSNVGRLVALLREGVDGHARESCISLDKTRYGLEY